MCLCVVHACAYVCLYACMCLVHVVYGWCMYLYIGVWLYVFIQIMCALCGYVRLCYAMLLVCCVVLRFAMLCYVMFWVVMFCHAVIC